jgi:hypothetical protein
MMAKVSKEQKRVLRHLRDKGPATPAECRCSVATYKALARRKLIFVATTFSSIAYPRTSARAEITESGRVAIFTLAARAAA